MQSAPARYVSVSELYSTDEVELLLDEIRELEPTSCRGEDVQDFEIAGSGCGGGGGGRSPAGTELTERSWDSHAQYLREPPPRPAPIAPLYCHLRYLLTIEGFFTLLIVLSSVCVCGLLYAGAGGTRLGGGARPLALGALSSALLHAALLLLRLSRLHSIMPLDWPMLGMWSCVWTLVSQCAGASVLLHDTLTRHAAVHLQHIHFAAVGVGYWCALWGGVAAGAAGRRAVGSRRGAGSRHGAGSARGAYRAVPTASPAPRSHSNLQPHSSDAPL